MLGAMLTVQEWRRTLGSTVTLPPDFVPTRGIAPGTLRFGGGLREVARSARANATLELSREDGLRISACAALALHGASWSLAVPPHFLRVSRPAASSP
jgi:hypothetical protein